MSNSQLLSAIVFFVLASVSSTVSATNSCSSYGWMSEGRLSGPSRMILGDSKEFSTYVTNAEKSESNPSVEFYTSETGYVGSKGYSSLRLFKSYSNIDITFNNHNSLGSSWVRAEEYFEQRSYIRPFCIDVTVQRAPTISMEVTDLYAVGSSLRGTIDLSGYIDPNYSLRGAASNRPAYTIEKKCEQWNNWQTVQENSVSSTHDFAMNCNLLLRARTFDGYFYSDYDTVNIRYSDVDEGDETGPDSTACVQACPYSLPHRSRCMQSNPVCH